MPKKSREEIEKELTQKWGVDSSTLSDKSYSDTLQLLKSYQEAEDVFSQAEEQPDGMEKLVYAEPEVHGGDTMVVSTQPLKVWGKDQEADEKKEGEEAPDIFSPEWTPYVLGLLTSTEKINNHPKTDGLRRVAHMLLSDFSSETDVIDTPTVHNNYRATVRVRLMFRHGLCIDGVADVYGGNTDPAYARYAVATAETRAEGRALRRALKLIGVIAAEESSPDIDIQTEERSKEPINNSMLTSLKLMAERANVDLHKLAVFMGYNIDDLTQLKHGDGIRIADKIAVYVRNDEETPNEIKK